MLARRSPASEGWGGTKVTSAGGFFPLRALLRYSRPFLPPFSPRSGWGLLNTGCWLCSQQRHSPPGAVLSHPQ